MVMATLLMVSGGILEYIKTEDWIAIGEVIRQLDLTEEELMKVLDFLSEFEFIEFDADRKKIRITDLGKRLLELPKI